MPVHVSAAFDSGNIEVLDATHPGDVALAIRPDAGGEHFQWFHFRVAGARGVPCRFRLTNASKASYPDGWPGYRAVATTDRATFVRVPTRYDGGELVIEHTPPADLVWYSYFAPFGHDRHQDLIARCQRDPRVRVDRLGATVDGRDLDRLVVGAPGPGKRVLWVIARQHPGETMAEWWMEGFLERLLDADDPVALAVLRDAVLHVVPNMNPDGSARGHLRCNAAGANLNREWAAPTLARSPEVLHTLAAMDASGVDFCLDVHGDEGLPWVFGSGAEGIPGWSPRLADLDRRFRAAYEMADPAFQQAWGYPLDAPGQGNLTMCTNAVAQRFDCFSLTLEMPFKDDAGHPDAAAGWSPERSSRLGARALEPILAVLHTLR